VIARRAYDGPSPHRNDEQVADLIPGARLIWLDGVAHVPHLEGDPATLDEIAAFVDSLA